jgi:hypothetical protein
MSAPLSGSLSGALILYVRSSGPLSYLGHYKNTRRSIFIEFHFKYKLHYENTRGALENKNFIELTFTTNTHYITHTIKIITRNYPPHCSYYQDCCTRFPCKINDGKATAEDRGEFNIVIRCSHRAYFWRNRTTRTLPGASSN